MKTFYSIEVHSTKTPVRVAEITTAQQKVLVKSITNGSKHCSEFLQTFRAVLLENLEAPTVYHGLTVIDVLIIALEIRAMSVSSKIPLSFECDACNKRVNAESQLAAVLKGLVSAQFTSDGTAPDGRNGMIMLGVPRFDTLVNYAKSMESEEEELSPTIAIRYTRLLAESIEKFTLLDYKWCNNFYDRLPVSVSAQIKKFIQQMEQALNNTYFIDLKCPCGSSHLKQNFSLKPIAVSEFLKFLFSENLSDIYEDIYQLTTRLKFSSEYIEQCTPAERSLFWGYHNRDERRKAEAQNNGAGQTGELPDGLDDEGAEYMPSSTEVTGDFQDTIR